MCVCVRVCVCVVCGLCVFTCVFMRVVCVCVCICVCLSVCACVCTVHRKYLAGENFKLLTSKNLANKQQSVHMPYTFSVYLILVLMIQQIRQFFPYQNFPVYDIVCVRMCVCVHIYTVETHIYMHTQNIHAQMHNQNCLLLFIKQMWLWIILSWLPPSLSSLTLSASWGCVYEQYPCDWLSISCGVAMSLLEDSKN